MRPIVLMRADLSKPIPSKRNPLISSFFCYQTWEEYDGELFTPPIQALYRRL